MCFHLPLSVYLLSFLLSKAERTYDTLYLVTNNEVEAEQQELLTHAGFSPGDLEWEAQGIFYRATKPRVEAVVTGVRTDGSPIPRQLKNADGTSMSLGVSENVAFFDLVYCDPDRIEIGSSFEDTIPALWLTAGAVGDPSALKPESAWLLLEHSPLAVLLDEDNFRPFLSKLRERPDVTHVWLVTDSEAAFARMRERIPGERQVGMLYREYLHNFVVNAEVAR
jgi:adenine-specific DNA-methyltransferase